MMKKAAKAFMKLWASFFMEKMPPEENLIYKSRIIRGQNLRGGTFLRAKVRFCSVLESNLSGIEIKDGGDFTGNGWDRCSFFGANCRGLTMEMEDFVRCSMGNMLLDRVQILEIKAADCNCAGSRLKDVKLCGCVFRTSNFRKVCLEQVTVEQCVFENCVFDNLILSEVRVSEVRFVRCRFYEFTKIRAEKCIFDGCRLEKY